MKKTTTTAAAAAAAATNPIHSTTQWEEKPNPHGPDRKIDLEPAVHVGVSDALARPFALQPADTNV